MSLEEIKAAVCGGRRVFWVNENYEVVCDAIGQWLIVCRFNGHCIGLTWADGVTVNGKPEEFYCAE
jgi:hypothetical protein